MASLNALSRTPNTQVLLTTHNPVIVKQLSFDSLRLISEKNNNKIISRVEKGMLLYPSLNEINYIAFGELTEEYHNELYGYIESDDDKIKELKSHQGENLKYIRTRKNGDKIEEKRCLSHYIRDQIHHPENRQNERFTDHQIKDSIARMREFINTY